MLVKKFSLVFLATAVSLGALGCGDDDDDTVVDGAVTADASVSADTGTTGDGSTTTVTPCTSNQDVSAELTASATWTIDKCYILKQHVFVAPGATLTIEPGTIIKGDARTSLVIRQGAKIMANGTREKPIVMTSSKVPGTRARGDWGGLVVLGSAPINATGGTQYIEGFPAPPAETRHIYGGSNPTDNSGVIKYVRIEFAGFELTTGKELNGLSMGGVGSGTVVENVQVHQGADDGVEMFGGTANLKRIIITAPDDDGLDWDFGWQGKVQFLIIQQGPNNGDNGYESDNNPSAASFDATPRSSPTIYNVTMVSSRSATKNQRGMTLRTGTAGALWNHIITGFSTTAIDVRDMASGNLTTGTTPTLFVNNSLIFMNGATDNFAPEAQSPADNDMNTVQEHVFFRATERMNRELDPMLMDATNLTAPNFMPRANSPALSGQANPTDPFFEAVTYVGAVGPGNDWATGWTAFPAN